MSLWHSFGSLECLSCLFPEMVGICWDPNRYSVFEGTLERYQEELLQNILDLSLAIASSTHLLLSSIEEMISLDKGEITRSAVVIKLFCSLNYKR